MSVRRPSSCDKEEDDDTRCGFAPCQDSLKTLATKKVYIIVYSFLGFFQAMFFSYFNATLTTIEKQFQFSSRTMGIMLSGNECSQILLSIVLTYFAGNGHRPRLVSLGMLFSGIASLLVVVPHFVYVNNAPVAVNGTRNGDVCTPGGSLPSDCNQGAGTTHSGARLFIFASQFIAGVGTTLFNTLGITYLDDNVKKKHSPMFLGLTSSLRMVGPTMGYTLARVFLSLNAKVTETTTLKPSDPAWIGAWWLGFLVIGVVQLATGWIIGLFPRRLPPKSKANRRQPARVGHSVREFPAALKRLLTNKILLFNNLASGFYVFAIVGYVTFTPKYLETQFQQSAAQASFLNGTIATGSMAMAFLVSGMVISRFRPRAWVLAVYDVVVGLVFVGGLVFYAFWGCHTKAVRGLTANGGEYQIEINTDCNSECRCSPNRLAPVCSTDGQTNYFSACHSGCRSVETIDDRKIYSDCRCLNSWSNASRTEETPGDSVTVGYCPSDCYDRFLVFLIGTAVLKFFMSTGRVHGIITGFRCVDQNDKAFAIGLESTFISLVAWIPAPIVYGAIIDHACILWRTDCGVKGNCWMYDPTKFRQYLHATTATLMMIATFFNIFVCFFVRNLDLYREDEETPIDHSAAEDGSRMMSNVR